MKLYISYTYFFLFNGVFSLNIDSDDFCDKNCTKELELSHDIFEWAVLSQEICQCNIMSSEASSFETSPRFYPPELYCRADDEFTVEWRPWQENFMYLLELREKNSNWTVVAKTTQSNFTFHNLSDGERYQVRLWGSEENTGNIWGWSLSQWFETMTFDYIPSTISNITLTQLSKDEEGFYVAVAEWTPNKDDSSCFYDILLFDTSGVTNYREIEIKEAQQFRVTFDKLLLDSNYSLKIMTKSKNWKLESEIVEVTFLTPSCLEEYKNLSICKPPEPTNVTTHESSFTVLKDNTYVTYYNITVFWDKPKLMPEFYQLLLTNMNYTLRNISIPGNDTKAELSRLELSWGYHLVLTAISAGGSSNPVELQKNLVVKHLDSPFQHFWLFIIVGIVGVTLCAVLGAFFYIYHVRAKRQRYEQRCKYFEELEEKASKIMDGMTNDVETVLEDDNAKLDSWELKHDRVVLRNVLGEGAFGLVRRAWLRDEKGNASLEVAVKMLKGTPTSEQVKQFLHEINIMKTVGSHPNLVSILGCCTRPKSGENMMLVVEYCALGDLQNYLREIWKQMTSQPLGNITYAELALPSPSHESTNITFNKLYDLEPEVNISGNLQPNDLLSFARQIATGMEYVTGLKVLHRDLAARNVLVCNNKTVKVADFGLSRDVYKDNIYQKLSNGKLPIRWMAPESLTHQVYTAQSDVWSFGILLWEIVTLGGNPYPSIPTNSLVKLLNSGYRMERPSNCGLELYTIMLACWKERPKDRPTFTELRKSLDALLETVTTAKYLDLDVLTSSEFASFRISIDDASSATPKSKKKSNSFQVQKYMNPNLIFA